MASTDERFTTVRSEGALLPPDLLQRIAEGDGDLKGLRPDDYHLVGEKLNEAINRAWSRLQGAWAVYSAATRKIADDEPTTSLTREKWLLPLFAALDYGRLTPIPALEIDGKRYAISHRWQRTPIHLVGRGVDLDRRSPGVVGAARASPHSQVQELLNRSDEHLWALVSNGRRLRLLRDNLSLTRQAYVEFDLEALMEGQVYPDFALLWLLCHQSRVEGETPEDCWLERWARAAQEQGTRALDRLHDGVAEAISALGRGFLLHPANAELRDKLHAGTLDKQDYYRQLLRQVFRLIFLFVAEDRTDSVGRALLFDPQGADEAMERYRRYYSTARLRKLAERRRGSTHPDLWRGLALVMGKLDRDGSPNLALPALGSFLWSPQATPDLEGCDIANRDLLDAVRALAFTEQDRVLRAVDYRNLGPEELGSVYESLLELHPVLDSEGNRFELESAAGHERKTTGSYYTPSSLIACLLDSALDPVLDEAAAADDPEAAILALRVCDPACGSGHFLIAAAHRIAKRLAAVRTGDDEPSPEATRTALRDVIGHSIYGVDLNPMAVELCKVNLWLDALEPGKPLSFLDHHIQCGNSLLGTTPVLLEKGIPDEAFKPIAGDDKAFCRELRQSNKGARESRQHTLFDTRGEPWMRIGDLATGLLNLDEIDDDSAEGIRKKEERWQAILDSQEYETSRMWADAWCAAFVWTKVDAPESPPPITELEFRKIEQNPKLAAPRIRTEIRRLAEEYKFFHWHLAFPGILRPEASADKDADTLTGWGGGFDVILGNPPWEELQFEETSWFATRDHHVAAAKNAAERTKRIEALRDTNPQLHREYRDALRLINDQKALIRQSGLYPNSSRGKINTYALFSELTTRLVAPAGKAGLIIPTGIATDKNTRQLFRTLMSSGRIDSLFDFVNQDRLFTEIRPHQHFCLLTLTGSANPAARASLAAFLVQPTQLLDKKTTYSLSWDDIVSLNPEAQTLVLFPSRQHAEVSGAIAKAFPPLGAQISSGEWGIAFKQGTFNTAADANHFRTDVEPDTLAEDVVPLFDAKMARQYEWRAASISLSGNQFRKIQKKSTSLEELKDPSFVPRVVYWVSRSEVDARLGSWSKPWLLGFKDVTGVTSRRMAAFSVIPRWGVAHSFPILTSDADPRDLAALLSWMNSLQVEFVLRQRMHGLHLTWHLLRQLPTPSHACIGSPVAWQEDQSLAEWLAFRVAELSVTSWTLLPFAKSLRVPAASPFVFAPERRFLIRAEIDAAWFVTAGLSREQLLFVCDSLEKLRRRDERTHDEYRTKIQTLAAYDAMKAAITTGEPYQSTLYPPPADSRVTHPSRAISEMASLPDGAWERPMADPEAEQTAVLAAVLKSSLGPLPIRQVRLAALLATSPELLSQSLPADEAAHWRRLIGPEAESSGAGDSPVPLPEDAAWGGAVRQLRGVGALIEDLVAQTWAPGEKLSELSTAGWPAGRVGVVLEVLRHRGAEDLIQTLPLPMKAWIDAKAA